MESNIDMRLENESLKKEFKIRSLDLYAIWNSDPDDLELENRRLHLLLDWVDKFHQLGSRELMMTEGYNFPPISFPINPDSDWGRVELWMKGEPVSFKLPDEAPPEFFFENPDELSDEEIKVKLKRLTDFFASRKLFVDIRDAVPERLLYEHLLEMIEDECDFAEECSWHLDGCDGCCPSCFQRPWCETGIISCWSEDVEAGEMVITDSAKRFLSPLKISLSILKECQKKEDEAMEKYNNLLIKD